MSVAQQEQVLLNIHLPHFILNAVEQSELVKMSQSEHGRAVIMPVFLSYLLGVSHKRRKHFGSHIAEHFFNFLRSV